MGQGGGQIGGKACEFVALQCEDLQLVEALECSGLDGTDTVVLQIQAGEVPQLPQGPWGYISDAVFLKQQGLEAGGQAAWEAGQQIMTKTELLQARQRSQQVVHVTELVSGHRQGRCAQRDGTRQWPKTQGLTQNQNPWTNTAAARRTWRHDGDAGQRTDAESQKDTTSAPRHGSLWGTRTGMTTRPQQDTGKLKTQVATFPALTILLAPRRRAGSCPRGLHTISPKILRCSRQIPGRCSSKFKDSLKVIVLPSLGFSERSCCLCEWTRWNTCSQMCTKMLKHDVIVL